MFMPIRKIAELHIALVDDTMVPSTLLVFQVGTLCQIHLPSRRAFWSAKSRGNRIFNWVVVIIGWLDVIAGVMSQVIASFELVW